jgi:hypothetical protein
LVLLHGFYGVLSFVLYFPDTNHAVLISLEHKCITCEQAQVLALHDFDKGIKRLVLGGYSAHYNIRDSIFLQEYGVEVIHDRMCVGSTEEVYCYSMMMARLLAEEYGWDFYDHGIQKVKNALDKLRTGSMSRLPEPPRIPRDR